MGDNDIETEDIESYPRTLGEFVYVEEQARWNIAQRTLLKIGELTEQRSKRPNDEKLIQQHEKAKKAMVEYSVKLSKARHAKEEYEKGDDQPARQFLSETIDELSQIANDYRDLGRIEKYNRYIEEVNALKEIE
jgi:hypothetical protein